MLEAKIFPEFETEFYRVISIAKEKIPEYKVCITGLCRNVEARLESNLTKLDHLGSYFKKCSYVIYENDSTDNTPNILKNWRDNNPDKFIFSEILNSTHPIGNKSKAKERTIALSNYRNKCKQTIIDNVSDIDYIIVIDLDFQTFSLDGLLHSFGFLDKSTINAMAGNSFGATPSNGRMYLTNYDSWAFRHNWWQDYQSQMSWFPLWQPLIGTPPIKVNSAFGGSCIYESKYYLDKDCNYEGYDCEHVCLHKNIYTKFPEFNLSLNPAQLMIV